MLYKINAVHSYCVDVTTNYQSVYSSYTNIMRMKNINNILKVFGLFVKCMPRCKTYQNMNECFTAVKTNIKHVFANITHYTSAHLTLTKYF